MNFKPSKWKVLVSIIILIVWYLFLSSYLERHRYMCEMLPCPPGFNSNNCEKIFVFNLLPDISCGSGCNCPESTPFSKIILDLVIVLFPGILLYLLWSLTEKKK